MKQACLAMITLFAFATSALAQDETNRSVKYKERTEIDFEGVDVSGELAKPAVQLLRDRKRANFHPLIRLRENFVDEMSRSVDDVK